ncbi:MAG: hypothetical protein AUJ52_05230 [Elusimicrobia bacterium CG1_02_63_36]|nr:MAG: hypothetical protein AUJ52_05230 [Elusimicrobia bacterium CG1_02_63_36]PJA15385.1 MAG: hypothetical protein COX66_10725 [Elusimicrobia bacterium CG_4_10_14_0_2_um_filter_63_34]PJB26930.1 MAG: hypothetical protein CO113_00475 [Elusimicrobia bacterium CG_4_9_14_3_um_filter_62_55]
MLFGILKVQVEEMKMNHKYLYNALAAVLIAAFAAPAFAAVNTKDDGLEGREVGTPIRVKKNGKWVWDICVPTPGMKCDFNGQMKVAKSAEQEACEANPELCDLTKGAKGRLLTSLDPNAGDARPPSGISAADREGRKVVCSAEHPENCSPGQQMGGDPSDGDAPAGAKQAKKKGQQMGPDLKEFMKQGFERFAELGLN